MTATTRTTRTTPATRMRDGSVATAFRGLFRGQLTIALWALLVIVVAAALTIGVLAVARPPDYSIVGFARQGVIWFPFSLAIAVAVGQLNVQVGMGRTRRAFGRAALLAALAMSVVYAVGVVGLIELGGRSTRSSAGSTPSSTTSGWSATARRWAPCSPATSWPPAAASSAASCAASCTTGPAAGGEPSRCR